jgi:hypothetical protein
MTMPPNQPWPQPPPEVSRSADEGVRALVRRGAHRASRLVGAPPESVRLTRPHEIYAMGLNDIRDGAELDAARPTGWRFIVERDDEPAAIADVLQDPAGSSRLSRVGYGRDAGGTDAAFRILDRVPARLAAARVVVVAAIYLSAAWIIDAGGVNLLVPIEPVPPGWEPLQPYTDEDFLNQLRRSTASFEPIAPDSYLGS